MTPKSNTTAGTIQARRACSSLHQNTAGESVLGVHAPLPPDSGGLVIGSEFVLPGCAPLPPDSGGLVVAAGSWLTGCATLSPDSIMFAKSDLKPSTTDSLPIAIPPELGGRGANPSN